MEIAAGQTNEPSAAKRQRVDDGSATGASGGGGASANGKANGAATEPRDKKCQEKGGRQQHKKGGGRDHRVGLIHQAIKRNNLKFAMDTFRETVADGLAIPITLVNSMMYVACGGEQWERYVRGLPPLTGPEAAAAAAAASEAAAGNGVGGDAEAAEHGQAQGPSGGKAAEGQQQQQQQQQQTGKRKAPPPIPEPEGPPPSKEELLAAVDELWSYVSTARLAPDSGTYLGLARREAIRGDPERALSWARECFKKGMPVQLRLFHPAQVGYCMAADVVSLLRVDALIASHRLDNTEYEYARLLEGIAAAGTYEQLRGVLMRVQSDLNQVAPATAAHIAAFFEKSPAAQQAFVPPGKGGCPVFAALSGKAAPAAQATAEAAPAAQATAEAGAVMAEAAEAAEAAAAVTDGASGAQKACETTEAPASADTVQEGAPSAEAAEAKAEASEAASQEEELQVAQGPAEPAAAADAAGPMDMEQPSAAGDAAGTANGEPEAEAKEVEKGEAEAEAGAARGCSGGSGWRWRVARGVAVDPSGRCQVAGGSLRVVDLEEEEWEAFAKAIADLARTNMGNRAADFDGFVEWYDRNGPYDILVDAANVAFFGQNYEGGGFDWDQIRDMYEMLRKRFPKKKILVMLHRKRLSAPEARSNYVQSFLDKLRRSKSFYYTPPGANDDWFWLYACVRAKQNGMLVSNDELRDHLFSLLRPKHFLKWKERHIAHYAHNSALTPAELDRVAAGSGKYFELQLPGHYTACVQQLPETAAWMVPLSDGTWMCARPERVPEQADQ